MKLAKAKKLLLWRTELCGDKQLSEATDTVLAHCADLEQRLIAADALFTDYGHKYDGSHKQMAALLRVL